MKKFIDLQSNEHTTDGLEYFASGLVVEEFPDNSSGKEVSVEFIDPWGEYVHAWRSRSQIEISDISDEEADRLKMAYEGFNTYNLETEIERAWDMLGFLGISEKRAGSVSNGIQVLSARYQKEIAQLKNEILQIKNLNRDLQDTNDYLRLMV
jgi:hypothetical protein